MFVIDIWSIIFFFFNITKWFILFNTASEDNRRGSVSRSRGGSPVSRNKNMTHAMNGPQANQSYGRHAAHKHPDTMAKVIHGLLDT